jgi:predicted GIY-YIG superfamily endonuclease
MRTTEQTKRPPHAAVAPSKECSLYRHFAADGTLLYVGISLNPLNRLGQHKHNAAWFDKITRVAIEQFPSWAAALEAERNAIKEEKPLYNIAFAPKEWAITQDQLAALLDVTPRAINEMRKRRVLPEPATAYSVAWTDRRALAAALREIGILGQFVAIQIERGAL